MYSKLEIRHYLQAHWPVGATSPQKYAAGNSSKGRGYMLQGQHPRRRGLTAPLDSPFQWVSPPETPDQRRGLWTRSRRGVPP